MVAEKYKKTFAVWWIGFSVLVLGIVCLASYQAIFNAILSVKLPLSKNSNTFSSWKDIPTPLYFKVYFFNVTNPQEILKQKAVPDLHELGPYTFRLHWTKEDIVFNNNKTVTFRENSKYIFLRNESIGSLADNVTTINAPMVIGATVLKDLPLWQRVLYSLTLDFLREKLFIVKTIRELVFDGYFDPVTALGPTFNKNLPDNKGYFSWFYKKNNTNDGIFVAYTGSDSMSKFNVIERWNGESDLKFWSAPSCNMINGSNGELNPPITKGQEILYFFKTDLCRSWTLTFEGTVDHYSLPARRFVASPMVLANSSLNPDNYCFEQNGPKASGIIEISPCQYGTPIFLSQPHFFQGDPILREEVNGMEPNETLHSMFMEVEPISGITLTLGARTQVNIHLQSVRGISQFKDVPDIILPVLWQEIVGSMPEKETADLKHQLMFPPFLMSLISFIILGIGALIALAAAITALYIHFYKRNQTSEALIDKDDEKQQIISDVEEEN